MKHEQRNNRFRYHGGRPPPRTASTPWALNGMDINLPVDLSLSTYAGRPAGKATEAEQAARPASRYRSLLVPLDGSPFSEHAIPMALAIARRSGASVRLVHVHVPPVSSFELRWPHASRDSDRALKQSKQTYLDGLLRRLSELTTVRLTPVLIEGWDVADGLCKVAGAATDLVVMATHGRGPLGRLWHGGLADALVRRLPAPVLLVRGHDVPVDLTGDPAPRRLLVPLDGSEGSEKALGPALDLGAVCDAEHTLLRVIPQEPDLLLAHGLLAAVPPAGGRKQAEAWDYFRSLARRLNGSSKLTPRLLLAEQSVAASILWYARKQGADLIALATRERSPLARLLRGGVADHAVRRSTTPVLLVRQGKA